MQKIMMMSLGVLWRTPTIILGCISLCAALAILLFAGALLIIPLLNIETTELNFIGYGMGGAGIAFVAWWLIKGFLRFGFALIFYSFEKSPIW